MRSTNLRNKPVDRRYLSDKDKSDYNQSGMYSRRATALSRARGRKGQMAYQANRPMNTTTRRAGTGGNFKGIDVQQARMRVRSKQTLCVSDETSVQQRRSV